VVQVSFECLPFTHSHHPDFMALAPFAKACWKLLLLTTESLVVNLNAEFNFNGKFFKQENLLFVMEFSNWKMLYTYWCMRVRACVRVCFTQLIFVSNAHEQICQVCKHWRKSMQSTNL